MSFERMPMGMQRLEAGAGQRPGVLKVVGFASVAVGMIGLVMILVGCLIGTVMGLAAMGGSGERIIVDAERGAGVCRASVRSTKFNFECRAAPVVESSSDGLDGPASETVASAMQKGFLLSLEQRGQLIALLRRTGKTIFPGGPGKLTAEAVHEHVSACGLVEVAGSSKEGLYFIVGSGRVEAFDDHATFRAEGASDVVSVRAADDAVVPPPTSSALGASTRRVVHVPVTVRNVTVASRFSLGIMVLDYLVGTLLSAFVLVAGILLLRGAHRAVAMHWVYVWTKIPLVVLAGASNWYFLRGYGLISSGAPVVVAQPWAPVVGGIIMAMIGLAYPVILIVVLRGPAVRAYVASVS